MRRCTTAFWTGRRRAFAWSLTLGLAILTIAQAAVPVALNLWSQRLFDALEQRNFGNVAHEAGVAILIILANMLVMTLHLGTKRRLQVEWRGDLTRRILDQWMIPGRDFLVQKKGGLDNPDGRIAEDVRVATEAAIDLGHSLFYCVLLLASFAQILWGLSGTMPLVFGGWEVALPGYLVWIAILYAGVGAAIAVWLGQPLTRAANLLHAKEADFRFGLASVRESGSTIRLQSIDSSRPKVERQFDGLIGAFAQQTRALAHLITFSSGWSIISQAAPILVAAPRYIAGTITLGVLMQIAQAFQQMTQALAWPIENMQRLAEARASFNRVTQLQGLLVESDPDTADFPITEINQIEYVDQNEIEEELDSEISMIAAAMPATVAAAHQQPARLH
jgi:putative ATP-binding cassette transporter